MLHSMGWHQHGTQIEHLYLLGCDRRLVCPLRWPQSTLSEHISPKFTKYTHSVSSKFKLRNLFFLNLNKSAFLIIEKFRPPDICQMGYKHKCHFVFISTWKMCDTLKLEIPHMILAFDMISWTFAKEIRALMHAKENLFFFFFTSHDIVYTRTEQETKFAAKLFLQSRSLT